jgi:hypothetical protein
MLVGRKATRAEPASPYVQNLGHHFGTFPELEDQMCEWIPGAEKSSDRVDALVWAVTQLNIFNYRGTDDGKNEYLGEVGYGEMQIIEGYSCYDYRGFYSDYF